MKNHNKGVDLLLRLTVILFGTFLLAFTYYHINFQNHLTEGGFVGLSLLGKYVLGISPSISILFLDVPVLLIAVIFKGKAFVCNTFISVAAFTIFYGLMERYSTLIINLQENLPVAALLSGVLTGLGAGIILRSGAASGGDDILSLLISEWKGIKVGTVFILMDVIVLALSLFYMPMKETMYTVMAVVVAGYVITFTTSLGRPKLMKAPKMGSTIRQPNDSTVM